MATFEGLTSLQPFLVPPGAYATLSPEQQTSAARYGIQRSYTTSTRLVRFCGREGSAKMTSRR